MTAMTDVAFLLLTFFMLATKFKPDEPVTVDTPSSISEIKLPETDIMLVTIDKNGRVFYSIDGQYTREKLIAKMGEKYNITFTETEIKEFSLLNSFGIPVENMKTFLALKPEERTRLQQPGIPADSLNNQLADWIRQGRLSNNNVRVAVKADGQAEYPIVKKVIDTFQDQKVNRFNLITTMERAE
jgi:biopolymer transport protein ExbD